MIQFLLILLSTFYLVDKLQYDYHMFQHNSYRPERYWRWLRGPHYRFIKGNDNLFILSLLLLGGGHTLLAGAGLDLLKATETAAAGGLLLLGGFFVWLAYKGHRLLISVRPSKKPLVYTARVKRMMATMALVLIAMAYGAALLPYWYATSLYAVLATGSFVIPILTVWINTPMEKGINRWYYKDAQRILAENPNRIIIGITGSYGKTSTKNVLAEVLSRRFNVLATPASYNTLMGVIRTIRENLRPTHEIFIVEMGARQPGDIQEICDLVQPHYGVITSIGPQHLETMGSLENIIQTKGELFEGIRPGGTAFVNLSDDNIAKLQRRLDIEYIGFGTSDSKDRTFDGEPLSSFIADALQVDGEGTGFTLHTPSGTTVPLRTRLLGAHNVGNVLSSLAIASKLGIADDNLQKQLVDLRPIEHRLSLRKGGKGQIILDDAFNSNPVGSKSALDVLHTMVGGKKVVITPGMIELGDEQDRLNKALGTHMADRADHVVLVGEKQTQPIRQGLLEAGFEEKSIHTASSFIDGWKHVDQITGEGDVILIENDLPDSFNE